MTTAVLTIAHGRHAHLASQIAGLRAGKRQPDLHVVAAMDDPAVSRVVSDADDSLRRAGSESPTRTVVVEVPIESPDRRDLPLAAARNAAAQGAVDLGADRLVFLDVDCIPGRGTVRSYVEQLDGQHQQSGPTVLLGDVAYLPPLPDSWQTWADGLDQLSRYARHRADRPVRGHGERREEPDLTRFWSLSFAVTAADFGTIGGFCPDYRGYGGEDTDFAQLVGARGGHLVWVGGATAYHQHHATSSPPVEHLDAIVRNAGIFADRWGWWPMTGWLEAFREQGLAATDADGRWQVVGQA